MPSNKIDSSLANHQTYRMCVSIILGLIGFIGVFYASKFDFNGFSINFAWSIILPLLVTIAWGAKYGVISITLGLTIIYPFILGDYNGWASFVPAMTLFIWIVLHGYGATKREYSNKIYYNIYFLQFVYIVIRVLLYMTIFPLLITLNPPFWNPEAYTQIDYEIIQLFSVKGIIVESILLAVSDALLLLPIVRQLFKLKTSKGAIYNTKIMFAMVTFGLLFTIIVSGIQDIIIDKINPFEWLASPSDKIRLSFLLATILFVIMGGVTVRFVQRMLETQAALKIREKQYQNALDEIQIINSELEMRVASRTKALQNAVFELEEFSYTISHDLKSPLRAIDGYSQFMVEDYKDSLNLEVREMINSIQETCKEMIQLIDKLLEYSITSTAKLNKENVKIEALIREVIREFEIGNPMRQITLTFETTLPVVTVDKLLIKQMLTNIVSNAVKFSKDRKITEITVGHSQTEKEDTFLIKDNGVGFDMKYAGKLFIIFQRLHRRQEFEGTGIGLATIKKIVQKHHGTVWIESVVNQGTTVYFTIPKTVEIENEA